MKTKICILLCLAILLSCVSMFLSLSTLDIKDDSPVKDSTVDKVPSDKNEAPSDEPSDEPNDDPSDEPLEEGIWTSVELTDVTATDMTNFSFDDEYPPCDQLFKFEVEKDGLYVVHRSTSGSSMVLVDYLKQFFVLDVDYDIPYYLTVGDYGVGICSGNDIEVYRYQGDFSEFDRDILAINPEGVSSVIAFANNYRILQVICDVPTSVSSVDFTIGAPDGEKQSFNVLHNDGNGNLYFFIPSGTLALFANPSDFGSGVTYFEARGVFFCYQDSEDVEAASALDLTTLSLRAMSSVADEVESAEPVEIVSWEKEGSQEIIEYSDGRSFVNGEEVQWSDIVIVG